MAVRKAGAVWEGGLKGGKGTIKSESGALNGQYSFGSRFENGTGTNPEELVAAAHAGCFSMALSGGLERGGTPPTRVATDAACTVEKVGDAFRVTKMHLIVRATVPGITAEQFTAAAEGAKNGCPISGMMKGNVEVTMDAQLV